MPLATGSNLASYNVVYVDGDAHRRQGDAGRDLGEPGQDRLRDGAVLDAA